MAAYGLCLQSNLHTLSKGTCEAEFLKVKTCLSSSVRARGVGGCGGVGEARRVGFRRGGYQATWRLVCRHWPLGSWVMGGGGQWADRPRPLRVAFGLCVCVYGSWHAPCVTIL
jgi:hypothetical protein